MREILDEPERKSYSETIQNILTGAVFAFTVLSILKAAFVFFRLR